MIGITMNVSLERFESLQVLTNLVAKEIEWTLNNLRLIQTALSFKNKGVPKHLEPFKNSSRLLPTYDIDWTQSSLKNVNVTKFNNYLPALMGQSARSRVVNLGDDACNGCKRGNGKFQSCVQVKDDEAKDLFDGACMNCIWGSSARKCNLSTGWKL